MLAEYQNRFRFMLVDEYQDTNIAQYLFLRLLAQGNRNICCVGDDDQSIYGWRGAEVDNILRFDHDFPGAKVIRLERNYRSAHQPYPRRRLASDRPITRGVWARRCSPTSWTPEGEEVRVSVAAAWDSEEEARAIGDEIEALQSKGHSLDSMAILVRASLSDARVRGPVRHAGRQLPGGRGPRFYERMEIRDAMAYFRCVVQPADDLAFERIVNTPKRGLGEASLKLVHAYARANRIPLMQAASDLCQTEELKPKARTTLRMLLADFDRWRDLVPTMSHTELAEIILDESGYTRCGATTARRRRRVGSTT